MAFVKRGPVAEVLLINAVLAHAARSADILSHYGDEKYMSRLLKLLGITNSLSDIACLAEVRLRAMIQDLEDFIFDPMGAAEYFSWIADNNADPDEMMRIYEDYMVPRIDEARERLAALGSAPLLIASKRRAERLGDDSHSAA